MVMALRTVPNAPSAPDYRQARAKVERQHLPIQVPSGYSTIARQS
jgi:hypothetical protein